MAGVLEQTAVSRRQTGSGALPSRLNLVLPITLALVALVIRLHNIDQESLWLDEGYTLLFSGMALPKLLLVGGAHEHPPLYYLVVHTLLRVHSWYLIPRLVSAVAGAASVFVLFRLGSRLFTPAAGAVAAILLTLAPFQVWYGQDGRGYELAGLFVLLSYLCGFSALDHAGRFWWIGYALATLAALYTEYTTVFVLLPQALFVVRARRRQLFSPLLLSWAGVAIGFAPWLGMVSRDAAGIANDYWIPAPTPGIVATTVLEFLGLVTPCPSPPCSGHELSVTVVAGNETLVGMSIVAAAMTGSLALWALRRLELTVLTLWLLTPFAIVLSLAAGRSLYLDRVFLDATFPLYILLGWGVSGLISTRGPAASHSSRNIVPSGVIVPGAVATLTAVGMCIAGMMQLPVIYSGGANPDWRSAAHDFQAAYRPGQSVVFIPGVLRTLLASYLRPGWHATRETPLWSRSYLDVPGWQDRYPQPANPTKSERMRIEAMLRHVEFTEAVRGVRDVWLISYNYPGMNDSRRWYAEHGFHLLLSEIYSGDTRIELWSRGAAADFGPAAVQDTGFQQGWSSRGTVRAAGHWATMRGNATLSRQFSLVPGRAYSVNIEYRGRPPSSKPAISLETFDAAGHPLATFPRTEWYDFPVNGVWLTQPFGFVAPPGAVRARLTLANRWGVAWWRHVAVYQER